VADRCIRLRWIFIFQTVSIAHCMDCSIEVLFTPAEFQTLCQRDLSHTTCVVFDVLRATSCIVTALSNGAKAFIPVEEISEALKLREQDPQALLAGERDGLRIGASLTGGVAFDLGNSPREYKFAKVGGKKIISTTTNGTRALRACAGAKQVLAVAFLNLSATAQFIRANLPAPLILVCAGTGERTALEDALAAGALCDALASLRADVNFLDSAQIARRLYWQAASTDLSSAVRSADNARRLLANPELQEDVNFCLQRDVSPILAGMSGGREIVKL
jgi:2-phosphosulfolactate phosphatase